MNDALEIGMVILIGILIILLVIFSIASFFQLADLAACKDFQAVNNGLEYRWTFWTGCRINLNGVWVHYSNINYDVNSGNFQIEIDD